MSSIKDSKNFILRGIHKGKFPIGSVMPSVDVLAALPGVGRDLATQIVSTREQKLFADNKDLSARISGLNDQAASYLRAESGTPTLLISTATIQPSGTRKTVQLRLRPERQKKIIMSDPVVYKEITVVKFGNWEY